MVDLSFIEEYPADLDVEVEVPRPKKAHQLLKQLEEGNLVSRLEKHKEKTPANIYEDIMQAYSDAEQTMDKWLRKYKQAIRLAKMQPSKDGQDVDSKDFPFPGASTAMMPFVLHAMLDFASRASPELVWTDEIVKGQVNGMDQDQSKLARATRIAAYQNYQLTHDIPGWRTGQDKNIFALPCVGTTYKKTYYDYETGSVCSDFRMADRIIFNQSYDTFEDAPDKFEPIKYSRNDVLSYIRGEQGWDIAEDDELEDDKDQFEFIEAHCWIDLDGDGLKEPYCAVLFPEVNRIVCLYPDYDEDTIVFNDRDQVVKIRDKEVYTQYIFLPDPEGGPMGWGWGIFLGPMYTAINSLVRNNLDAGTLQLTSSNSGLIAQSIGEGRGNRQLSSRINVTMGTLTPYPMGALQGSLRENVVQFPFAGASPVLMQLMEYLVTASREMTTAAYQVEANQGEAASLYLARLQQALKAPNMIVMRVYECMRKEMQKIALLNFKHFDDNQYNNVLDEPERYSMEADFNPADLDVDLVADPSQGSDIERVGKAQMVYDTALGQASAQIQNVTNIREATIQLYQAQGIDDEQIARLCPPPPEGPSQMEKMMIAQAQMEAEFRQKELAIKEQELAIKQRQAQVAELKQAHEAAKSLSELGLQADKDEAEITQKYAAALKSLVDAGLSYQQAKSEVTRIESDFINHTGGENALQASLTGNGGPLA